VLPACRRPMAIEMRALQGGCRLPFHCRCDKLKTRQESLAVARYTQYASKCGTLPPPGQLSPGNHSRGHLPPVPDANPKMCAFLFCKSFPPQPFLFSYPGSLHGFSRLFTVISEHVFYFLVFLSLHFLVVGSVR